MFNKYSINKLICLYALVQVNFNLCFRMLLFLYFSSLNLPSSSYYFVSLCTWKYYFCNVTGMKIALSCFKRNVLLCHAMHVRLNFTSKVFKVFHGILVYFSNRCWNLKPVNEWKFPLLAPQTISPPATQQIQTPKLRIVSSVLVHYDVFQLVIRMSLFLSLAFCVALFVCVRLHFESILFINSLYIRSRLGRPKHWTIDRSENASGQDTTGFIV